MHHLKRFLSAIAVTVACVPAASGERPPVSYDPPESWTLVKSWEQRGATISLYNVKDDRGSAIPSNSLITIYEVPQGVSATDADEIVASRMKNLNAQLIASAPDDGGWKTYLYVIKNGEDTLVEFYRIGIAGHYGVEALLSFPLAPTTAEDFALLTLEPAADAKETVGVYCSRSSVEPFVSQFNKFSASLKISGSNTFTSRLKMIDPEPGTKYLRSVGPGK